MIIYNKEKYSRYEVMNEEEKIEYFKTQSEKYPT